MLTKVIGLLCVGVFLGAAIVEIRGVRRRRAAAKRPDPSPEAGEHGPSAGERAAGERRPTADPSA